MIRFIETKKECAHHWVRTYFIGKVGSTTVPEAEYRCAFCKEKKK